MVRLRPCHTCRRNPAGVTHNISQQFSWSSSCVITSNLQPLGHTRDASVNASHMFPFVSGFGAYRFTFRSKTLNPLLEELALSPLQVFWWRQTLEFWNTIAASPADSLFHTILLDNIHDAFHVGRGAKNFYSSVATCLQSVGHSMPRDSDVVPVMEVAAIIKLCMNTCRVLTVTPYTVLGQPRLLGLSAALTIVG